MPGPHMERQASLASALSSSTNTSVTPSEPSASFRITFACSPAQSLLLLPIIQYFAPFSSSSSVQSSKIPLESSIWSYVHKPVSCNTWFPLILIYCSPQDHTVFSDQHSDLSLGDCISQLNIIVPEKNPRVQKFDPRKAAISGGLYPADLEHAL